MRFLHSTNIDNYFNILMKFATQDIIKIIWSLLGPKIT